MYYFDSKLKKSAQSESNGSAIKNIPPFEVIKNWYFPLISTAEQARIVEKIEKIFLVLDNIDQLQENYSLDVEVLKSKLIDAGIRGELTEQLSEDGTVEELLSQIKDERKKQEDEGKIKKVDKQPLISDEEIPFMIPYNWKWVRLGLYHILFAEVLQDR